MKNIFILFYHAYIFYYLYCIDVKLCLREIFNLIVQNIIFLGLLWFITNTTFLVTFHATFMMIKFYQASDY